MSLTLSITAGGDSWSTPIWKGFSEAATAISRRLPSEAAILFEVEDFGAPKSVPAEVVREAAARILGVLQTGEIELGVRYSLEDEGGTTSSGMQRTILGVPHVIKVGQDTCTLQVIHVDPKGKFAGWGDLIDIRDRKAIHTDAGEVRIRRRQGSTRELVELLIAVREFSTKHQGETLTLVMG